MNSARSLDSEANLEAQTLAMLACELHDGPCQVLAAACYHLEASHRLQPTNPEAAGKEFDHGMNELHRALRELRTLIRGLRPLCIEGRSLAEAIRDLIREHAEEAKLQITFACTPESIDCSPGLQTAVFRIVQEGLMNVRRHSHSNGARVVVVQSHDLVRVEIEDWGTGFDPTAIHGECFGISGMRARAESLQGNLYITSSPGEGTRVVACIPTLQAGSPEKPRGTDKSSSGVDVAKAAQLGTRP